MDESNSKKALVFAIIVLLVIIFIQIRKIDEIQQDVEYLKDENYSLENKNDDLSDAIDEANNNIEQANTIIEDAKANAWNSYYEMGDALDNLETVYTVDNPN